MSDVQILWFRNDLRLADQPALRAAAAAGAILPVYVWDELSDGVRPIGGAARWWLTRSLDALDADLRSLGGRLLVAKGRTVEVLEALTRETGARAIHATRQTEPWWPAIEARLQGLLRLHGWPTLHPEGAVATKAGTPFRVFTPYWRAHLAHQAPPPPRPIPKAMRFADVPDRPLPAFAPRWALALEGEPGKAGAFRALAAFAPNVGNYRMRRDYPSEQATSRLSPHLHFGEISPAQCWHAVEGRAGAEDWQRQLVWRDFAHETLRQFPHSANRPHRAVFDRMPWTEATKGSGALWLDAWQRGRTGYPLVDAGMRQLWQSGWMHNRVRMVVASFLVKHLRIDWREGERWFWDTLVDADLANNAMGWQWVMGSGVDSAPYYRIFAPIGQSQRFEAAAYIRHWVPELAGLDDAVIHGPFAQGHGAYPAPIVDHATARAAALAAYRALGDLA